MVKALKCFALLIAALLLGAAGYAPLVNYRENIPVCAGNCFRTEDRDCNNCGEYQNRNLSLPSQKTRESVYLGGMPLGLEFKTRGLIIVGKTDVVTSDGLVNPTKDSNIEAGDILLSVEGLEVNTAEELSEIINREIYRGKELRVKIRRKGQEIDTVISSVKDFSTGIFKTGLWIRQDTFGVGTLTFIRKDLRYGALGHPVVDEDTKDILFIRGGSVRPCTVAGCIKGERGKPGEIKGMIIKNAESYGSVDKNGIYGVYGYLNNILSNDLYKEPVEIMPRSQVKPGKAYILTTLNGSQPQKYEIQIVKTSYQAKPCDRSMVIKITDYRLLSVTGGIVQGMSGSPIIQNDRLCGAVTHVFINDPTRGYGLYADWMVNQ
jgi:stage IV sporulation protein B